MVNWHDPAVIAQDGLIFNKIMLVMLGLYGWEVIVTFKYDMTIFLGRRKFKYPMAFYFICRYSVLFSLIGINIALNSKSKLNCQSLYVFNQLMGNCAIATASTLLMLRTIAIWSRNWYVVVPLCICSLGQWAILLHGVITVKATWSTESNVCVVTDTVGKFLDLIYVYTMTYDLAVLIISTVGLIRTSGRSDLWALLFRDGIVYFTIAFSANTVAAVLLLLNFNYAMNIIATVPACVLSSTVACRGFVRLSTWNSKEVYLPAFIQASERPPAMGGVHGSSFTATGNDNFAKTSRLGATRTVNEGVHIAMEAYTTTDRRNSHVDKAYDEADADSVSDDDVGSAVRYTRSERAQVTLSTVPEVFLPQDLTRRDGSPNNEKR